MDRTVLVTGATGKQGGAVARVLLERGHRVIATTRDPGKPQASLLRSIGVDVVHADYDTPQTMLDAMRGVDAAFLMATPYEEGPEAETEDALAGVNAAKEAGVKHLIYSSVASADEDTGIPHFESKRTVELQLERSDLRHTIVAPVWFMENLLGPWFVPGLLEGKLAMPLPPDRKLQMTGLQEIARVVAEVIDEPKRSQGERIEIASDELTMNEMAEVLTRVIGSRIRYEQVPQEKAQALGDDLVKMYDWFDRVGYSVDIAALRRDHPDVGWRSFEQWARDQDWSFLHPQTKVHAR